MKKLKHIIALLLLPVGATYGQARINLNNGYIVENGGTTSAKPVYLVIGNSNANAIVPGNGWIVSESEFDMVRWYINAGTGNYIVPFGYKTTNSLPLTLTVDSAGTPGAGTGYINFSTWHTQADNWRGTVSVNGPPTGVTNMDPTTPALGKPSATDNSYNTVNRFWVIDAGSYNQNPVLDNIQFKYIHGNPTGNPTDSSEVASPNVFSENTLAAQRFNPGTGWSDWYGTGGTDNVNGTAGAVSSGIVTANNLYRSWTLIASPIFTVSAFAGFNVSCNGGSNGQAKVSVNGGKAPYTYSWSPVSNSTYIANGLTAGRYTVTVTDNRGYSGTSAVTITQPALLRDSVATVSYPSCIMPTGSATIGVQGGTSPYRYTWSPNISTTNSATGLLVRSYAVQVKDNNSCWNTLNFSISQPPTLRDSIVRSTIVNTSCSSNGSATVGVKYGASPYTYSWSPAGGNGATANGLSTGTYTITVNDAGSCTATTSVAITQLIRPSLLATAYTGGNVSCNGGTNGQAKVSVTGGITPYTYSWNSGSTTYIANGLSAGTYTVTIQDNCGTSATSSTTISQPTLLVDSVASVNDPPCIGGTGNATIGVIGGTSPYRYTWSPNVSSTDSASGLTKRSYVVQVKDNNGCWNNITISITSCANPPTATYPKGIHSDKENEATCCPTPDNINLYPNPNTGQFTLSGLQKGMILEMYDYTGKKISSTTITNQTMQLNIFNQANGVYLIRILDKEGNLVSQKKVVKTQ